MHWNIGGGNVLFRYIIHSMSQVQLKDDLMVDCLCLLTFCARIAVGNVRRGATDGRVSPGTRVGP